MAPERLQGKSDGRDDIYALGATLYEFLALRPIFDGADPHKLLRQIEHEQPVPLRQIDRRIRPDLAAIIATALAKDPADRYATAGELRDELRRFIEGRPVKRRPVPAYARFWRWCKRNPWLAAANIAAAAATMILAIGSTIAAKVYHDGREQVAAVANELVKSEIQTREKLFEARTAQARASRFSHQVGQRFETLGAISEAAKIGRNLGLTADRFDPLRDEAIASMALPDLKPAGPPIRKPEGMIAFAFDPGMTRYAIRLRDEKILVRCMGDDQEIARFAAQGDRDLWVFSFSPNGRYLATTHSPGFGLTVWDVDRRVVAVEDPGRVWRGAKFSPDSRRIGLAREGEVLVYDLATGRPSRRWPGRASDLAFRPDGAQIAVIDNETRSPTCRILEGETGQLVQTFSLRTTADYVVWSPDGVTLATPGHDSKIDLWDTTTGIRRATLEGHINSGLCATFHPAGTLLASNGFESRLRLWDAVPGPSGIEHYRRPARRPSFQPGTAGSSLGGKMSSAPGKSIRPSSTEPWRMPRTRPWILRGRRSTPTAGSWPWARTGVWCSGTWHGVQSLRSCRSGWRGIACSNRRVTCSPTARPASCDGRVTSIRRAARLGSDHPEVCPCQEQVARWRRTERAGSSRWLTTPRFASHWLKGRSGSGRWMTAGASTVSPDGQWLATGNHHEWRRDDLETP